LITLTLLDGTTHFHWTTADFNILSGGSLYLAGDGVGAPLVTRGQYRNSLAPTIDTLDLKLHGPFTIGGSSLVLLAINGYFDGASVNVDHVISPTIGDLSLGVLSSWFVGPLAQVEPNGVNLDLRFKSQLELLNIMIPKFMLQFRCGNAAYDTNCGLNRTTWTIPDAIITTATTTVLNTATAGVTGKTAHYFVGGVVLMKTGAAAGQRCSVLESAAGVITLSTPLTVAPAPADTFDIYPGCDRSEKVCHDRFDNLAQYRGFPLVPAPEAGG
jgi:uncharacterized phage protein (TIGR02218 family)